MKSPGSAPPWSRSNRPVSTFPIVKRKDIAQFGEYRTKNLILEIYDAMQRAKENGQPYQTILDPPPAYPRVAHSFRQDG